MTTREYEALKEIDDTEELKETIDAFWLRNMDNAQQAQQVIELYYSRVEQANLQFSNFKDGWKTDMGFVYIMFGPPMYVDRALDPDGLALLIQRCRTGFNFYLRTTQA